MHSSDNTVNEAEVKKFSDLSSNWWDVSQTSPFFHLHLMNPLRVKFVLDNIEIKQKDLLDIGCGGGIASESFARLGALVTGIDASNQNIEAARYHSSDIGLDINYQNISLHEVKKKFDVITCFEVIEHVENLPRFLQDASSLLKPNGMLFISTINRTKKSYLAAIIAAEYIMKYVPIGTHDWNRFIKPSELCTIIDNVSGMSLTSLSGMKFNPISKTWNITDSVDVNYVACFRKNQGKSLGSADLAPS